MIDSFTDEYEFLSSFYLCEIQLDGKTYPSLEHAYHAAKTLDPKERNKICQCKTPGQAKRAGQKVTLRMEWEFIKVKIMGDLLRQKFAPGTDLAEKLLATGNEKLVEGNTWGDQFWGVCRGKGKNKLGKLLMDIREELRNNDIV